MGRVKRKTKLLLKHHLSPGDVVMLTAAIRDLYLAHGDRFEINVKTSCDELFENSPYLNRSISPANADRVLDTKYPLINKSNNCQYHFIHGFRKFLEDELKLKIPATDFKGDIHISEEERGWISKVEELDINDDYWIMCAGGKYDYTAKWWNPDFYQEVVSYFEGKVTFVQVGAEEHFHPKLKGVINLVGKTDTRQFIRLVYHSVGVVCPVTLAMHLAAAVPVKDGRPQNRACVVIAGGREPAQWEQYPHHRYLHNNGALMCCDNGGCWKSRCTVVDEKDEKNDDLCEDRVKTHFKSEIFTNKINLDDFYIPKCLDMIKPEHVISSIQSHYEGGALKYGSCLPDSIPKNAEPYYSGNQAIDLFSEREEEMERAREEALQQVIDKSVDQQLEVISLKKAQHTESGEPLALEKSEK